jgi:cytochrome P450
VQNEQAQVVDFDHHDPELNDKTVWEAYRQAREVGPVAWSESHGGFWMVTGYAEVMAALRDHETFSSADGHLIPAIGSTRSIPLDFDPPLHRQYRAVMTPPLARRHVEAMREVIRRFVEERLDWADGTVFDGVEELALPLPLMVLQKLIGLSAEAAGQLRPLTEAMWKRVTTEPLGTARAEIFALMRADLDRLANTDTYIGRLLGQQVGDRPITTDEAVRVMAMFALAGHETTLHAVGNLLADLAGHPGLQRRVATDRDLIPSVVEESLRSRAPAHMFARTLRADATLGGARMKAGDKVMLVYAAGNRDPGYFSDPDSLDPDRQRRPHFSFGWGIHLCIGAPMVRMELQTIVDVIAARPTLRFAGEPEYSGLEGGHHMGPRRLPLVFQPG